MGPDLVIQFIYGSMAVSNSADAFVTVDDDGYLVSLEGGASD